MVVDLPAPLGPRKPSTSPLATVQIDPGDGRDRAKSLGQSLDFDHGVEWRRECGASAPSVHLPIREIALWPQDWNGYGSVMAAQMRDTLLLISHRRCETGHNGICAVPAQEAWREIGTEKKKRDSVSGRSCAPTLVGIVLQIAMYVLGHYSHWVAVNVFGFGGMMISATAGYLYAMDAASGYFSGATGGAIAGGVCGFIGIGAVGRAWATSYTSFIAIGTTIAVAVGAIGGLFGQMAANLARDGALRSDPQRQSAIDHQPVAGDEAAVVGGEEQRRAGQIHRLAAAAQGRLLGPDVGDLGPCVP